MIGAKRRLGADEKGVALIEFALVAPVFLLMVLGGLELCHTIYVRSVLVGQLQKASRDLSLEDASATARQEAIRTTVENAVRDVMPTAKLTLASKSYHDYSNAANPAEEYKDANHNGVCDHGEGFVDGNRNGRWDADGGADGRGGAKDVVLLTATVTYDRLPFGRLFGSGSTMEMSAKTLLRNQPNDQQADPPKGTCP